LKEQEEMKMVKKKKNDELVAKDDMVLILVLEKVEYMQDVDQEEWEVAVPMVGVMVKRKKDYCKKKKNEDEEAVCLGTWIDHMQDNVK
jgi:phage terminase large subunit-like protein